MRQISKEEKALIEKCFREGKSISQAGKETGLARGTIRRIYKTLGPRPNCPCGQPSDHKGWCSFRYEKSPARQAVIAHFRRAGRAAHIMRRARLGTGPKKPFQWRPLSEVWPYGTTDDPIVNAVNEFVPKSIPYDVRCDACQDLCLAIVAGIVTFEDLERMAASGVRNVYRLFKSKWGPSSIDEERYEDGELLRESIPDPSDFSRKLFNVLFAEQILL